MGLQFSEEFLLGYRAGHRDGFADALLLMRDATGPHRQALALENREEQLISHAGSGMAPLPAPSEPDADPREVAWELLAY